MAGKRIRLQAALDMYSGEQALACAEQLSDVVDILEVGTPLLLSQGINIVKRLRMAHTDIMLVADTKIMDGGYSSACLAFEAGTNVVTVLGAAADITITDTVRAAHENNGEVMIDLINVPNLSQRIRQVLDFGATYILLHLPYDCATKGQQWEMQAELEEFSAHQIAIAGGINENNVEATLKYAPSIVIVGSAIYKADAPRTVAQRIQHLLR